jgi:hypothetical protein
MAANFSMDGQAMVKEEQYRMEEDESANTAFFLDIGQVGRICAFSNFVRVLFLHFLLQRDRKSRGYNIDQIYREQV